MASFDLASEYDRASRVQAASTSARSLLLTVLGTLVLPHGGVAWTASLLAGLACLSVNDSNGRQAIKRASRAGWLTSRRHGRRARWWLTEHASELLQRGADRIYPFGQCTPSWDGRWLVVLASVPESQRDARYQLRVQLGWAGFGSLGAGIWVSPWPEREGEARRVIESLGLSPAARSFVAHHGQLGEESQIVDEAWNLTTLAGDYQAFINRFEPLGPATPAEATRSLLLLVHAWRRFPAIDPALPWELLPPSWPGRQAATLFVSQRQRWLEPAHRWWRDTEQASEAS